MEPLGASLILTSIFTCWLLGICSLLCCWRKHKTIRVINYQTHQAKNSFFSIGILDESRTTQRQRSVTIQTIKPEQTSGFVVLHLHLVDATVSYQCSLTVCVCVFALLLCVNVSKENTNTQAVTIYHAGYLRAFVKTLQLHWEPDIGAAIYSRSCRKKRLVWSLEKRSLVVLVSPPVNLQPSGRWVGADPCSSCRMQPYCSALVPRLSFDLCFSISFAVVYPSVIVLFLSSQAMVMMMKRAAGSAFPPAMITSCISSPFSGRFCSPAFHPQSTGMAGPAS